jgi:ribosomal protein S17
MLTRRRTLGEAEIRNKIEESAGTLGAAHKRIHADERQHHISLGEEVKCTETRRNRKRN